MHTREKNPVGARNPHQISLQRREDDARKHHGNQDTKPLLSASPYPTRGKEAHEAPQRNQPAVELRNGTHPVVECGNQTTH